jgi:hypothetical protein
VRVEELRIQLELTEPSVVLQSRHVVHVETLPSRAGVSAGLERRDPWLPPKQIGLPVAGEQPFDDDEGEEGFLV